MTELSDKSSVEDSHAGLWDDIEWDPEPIVGEAVAYPPKGYYTAAVPHEAESVRARWGIVSARLED